MPCFSIDAVLAHQVILMKKKRYYHG